MTLSMTLDNTVVSSSVSQEACRLESACDSVTDLFTARIHKHILFDIARVVTDADGSERDG